jgi:hypothetical protein
VRERIYLASADNTQTFTGSLEWNKTAIAEASK